MKKVKETKNKKGFLVALGDFITNHRYFFLVLFLGMTVFGVFNINKVGINNSIISYLPDDTETKQGVEIMEEEFGSLTTIRLMVSEVALDEADKLAGKLAEVKNVKSVLFDETETSYKNEKALYAIELEDATDEEIQQVKHDIEEIVAEAEYSIYSEDFEDTMDGIGLALGLSVAVIVVILFVTSKTYFEPVIAFIVFGVSIVLSFLKINKKLHRCK